ncbi:hypothetical protein ACWDRB_08595 [Nonomuraea sp. NPDC003707]
MAIYHHVRDKEELLLLLLDDYAAGIPRPELPEEPRERVVAAAMAMHEAVSGCPWVVDVYRIIWHYTMGEIGGRAMGGADRPR